MMGYSSGPSGSLDDLIKQRDAEVTAPATLGGPVDSGYFGDVPLAGTPILGAAPAPAPVAAQAPVVAPLPSPDRPTIPTVPYNPTPARGVGVSSGPGAGVKAARGELLSTFGAMEEGKKKEAEAEAGLLEQKAGEQEKIANIEQRAMLDKMHIEAQKKAYSDFTMRALENDQAEIEKAQVDPNHHMNSMSGREKFQTNAAILLGAIGETLGAGSNKAWEMVQKNIDRDIDAQKSNLANKRASLQDKRSLYAMNLAKYGDSIQAADATKAQSIAAIQANVASMAAASGSKAAMAKADQSIAAMESTKKELMLKFAERDQAQAQAAAAAAARVQQVPEHLQVDEKRYVETTDSTGRLVTGYAPDKESAKELRDKLTANEDIANDMARVEALARQPGAMDPTSPVYQNIKSIQAGARTKVTVYRGQGAMSKGDEGVAEQFMADPTSWDPRVGGADVVKGVRERLLQERDNALQGSNVHLVQRQNLSQNGLITPVALPTGQMYRAKRATPEGDMTLGKPHGS